MSYSRFAVFYVPPAGPLADFGAAWLGWDIAQGRDVRQPDLPGLDEVTATPRKYGFHGTLKPPFRLAEGQSMGALRAEVADLAAGLAPASCDALALSTLGRFLALTPVGDTAGLQRVAAGCVRGLDRFRAAPGEAELAQRRKTGLNAQQEALLTRWGYPYVMEEFRFHMTLTGRLARGSIPHWSETVQRHLPDLPGPFVLDAIALCGERDDGRFELVHLYALAG